MVIAAVEVLPSASRAVTATMLLPDFSAMVFMDQEPVLEVVPLPPRLLAQVTCVTPTLSDAVPPRLIEAVVLEYEDAVVGLFIATTGGVVSEDADPPPVPPGDGGRLLVAVRPLVVPLPQPLSNIAITTNENIRR